MALYKQPKQAIIDAMGAQNGGLSLVLDQYTFGVPSALAQPDGLFNTQIDVTAIVPNSPYEGAVTVEYHRLDLADLQTLIPIALKATGLTTTLDVALKLNDKYGFNFTTDDIVSSPLSLTNGEGAAVLVAKDGSLGWIGTGTINITKGDYPIDQYVTVTTLPGMVYPAVDETKAFGYMYSYWRDFSSQKDNLAAIPTGTSGLSALRDVLATITGDNWQLVGTTRWSLDGANIAFNGVTSNQPISNQDYTNVMVVTLGAGSAGYGGSLYIHYGHPSDDLT